MEKIPCICAMRELLQTLTMLEEQLTENYGLKLNEAMVLCSVGNDTVSASTIAECTGMTPSHASKVIGAAEKKGLLTRSLGDCDKRQMHFALTDSGKSLLRRLKEEGMEMPEKLKGYFEG